MDVKTRRVEFLETIEFEFLTGMIRLSIGNHRAAPFEAIVHLLATSTIHEDFRDGLSSDLEETVQYGSNLIRKVLVKPDE